MVWCLSSLITVSNDKFNHVLEGIGKIVEPYLSVFRNAILHFWLLDLSPIVALLCLILWDVLPFEAGLYTNIETSLSLNTN